MREPTHSKTVGYILWIFGFTGSHRFYFGKPLTGILWLCTGGLFLVGWIVDLFLNPGMEKKAELRYKEGPINYTVAWVLQTFLGPLGIHRMYMEKWITGILYLCTAGLAGIGWAYDYCTLNTQISERNAARTPVFRPADSNLIEE